MIIRILDYTLYTVDLHTDITDSYYSQWLEICTPLGTQEIKIDDSMNPERLRWIADQIENYN
jgi:hypothetical protein